MDAARVRSLQALLAATARRDETAFSTLYELTSAKLFGVALRILKREDWAEDVVQDSYLNIWNNAASYSAGLSAPMTWMTTIVRNRCLDWLRRPNLEISAEHEDDEGGSLIDRVASDAPGPFEQLTQTNDRQAIGRCLQNLDAKQRQAVALAFFEGLSHSELAARMQEPLGTVKTWVRRGLERLKICLESAATPRRAEGA
jgi:RNA polymerase sigma-70 factor, ECF subfamily